MSITAEKVAAEICLSKGDRPCEADDLHRDGIRTQHCAHCQSTARAILSLLQQGEPEGWKAPSVEDFEEAILRGLDKCGLRLTKVINNPYNLGMEPGYALARQVKAAVTPANFFASASPLPPAPGAEMGEAALELLKKIDVRREDKLVLLSIEAQPIAIVDWGSRPADALLSFNDRIERALATTPPAEGERK